MVLGKSGRRKKSKKSNFGPNHAVVADAVERFLKEGGEIKKVDLNYAHFMSGKSAVPPADDFLMGV